MSIAKVVQVVPSSNTSFDDAVQQGLAGLTKTVRGVRGIKIQDWTAKVEDDKIVGYKVTMDVAFHVEES